MILKWKKERTYIHVIIYKKEDESVKKKKIN